MDREEEEEVLPLVEASEEPEKAGAAEESFSKVTRKRKRAKEADMDTSEGAAGGDSVVKRPAFPHVNVSTSLVR